MRRGAIAALSALFILGGCADDGDDATEPETPAATDAEGTTTTAAGNAPSSGPFIEGLEYHDMTVTSGDEVTVTNRDDFGHTFSFEGDVVEALVLGGGETGTFTTPAPGSYPVFCEIHGSMTATLEVQ